MRLLNFASPLFALVLLSGCASVIDGPTQNITLNTPGASEAECTLSNGLKYRIQTGETMRIMRSHRELIADCYASGDRHKKVIFPSEFNAWGATNVTNGVVPGATYDHLSGGLYTYPEVLTIDFTTVLTRGFDTPLYQNKDAPNPYTQAIESYAPGTPIIPEDTEYLKRGVQKRDVTVDSNPFSNVESSNASVESGSSYTGSDGAYNGGGSGPKYTGKNAEELTRSANPTVFKQ